MFSSFRESSGLRRDSSESSIPSWSSWFVSPILSPWPHSVSIVMIDGLMYHFFCVSDVDYEFSLLQLVDKLTNGTRIDVNEVGTRVRFYPGMIQGGLLMDHECGTSRGVGYYIEFLCTVAPFGKKPMEVLLSGCTNVEGDLSIDALQEMTIRMMTYFGIDKSGLAIDVISRGFAPEGGGKVRFSCPVVRRLNSVDRLSSGKIRRIRGTA
jgi:RNA 3'-terminal phosphate cyclase-like protein